MAKLLWALALVAAAILNTGTQPNNNPIHTMGCVPSSVPSQYITAL